MDICGPISSQIAGGKRSFFLIVDDYSTCMWVALFKEKSEALEQFKRFKSTAEAEKGVKIKCIRGDRGESSPLMSLRKCVTKVGLKSNLLPLIPHNIMGWLRERIELSWA